MKARVKRYFTRPRFNSYRTNKRLLVIFLLIVNAHIYVGVWTEIMNAYEIIVQMKVVSITREPSMDNIALGAIEESGTSQFNQADGDLVSAGSLEKSTKGMEEASTPPPSQDEIIKEVASRYDINWKIIQAICIKESNCDSSRTGDEGKSWGAYQIYSVAHPNVTKEQARDFEWATEWTAKRLKAHEHLGERDMVRSHNGLVAWNDYYVDDVYKIIETL